MKKPCHSLLIAIAMLPFPAIAGEAEDALFQAATNGDAPRIVLALSEANPDSRDVQGRTPLMLAAKAGDFESVRRLLWGGADASLKDPQGKMARDYLDLNGEAFAPLTLILRCYAFVQEYGRPGGKARIPNLALVNDFWIDPSHPKLRSVYAVNKKELEGRGGVDDDNNGFIDDTYGWNFQNDEPLHAPQLSIDESPETGLFLEKLITDYLSVVQEGNEKMGEILKGRYQNPLVRQIGFQTLAEAEIDLNDFKYAEMLYSASHGTHVAGIISKYSDGKARVIGSAIGSSVPPTGRVFQDIEGVVQLAAGSADYATFIDSLLDRYRGEAIAKGRRASDYLRACGAGVANMSWVRNRQFHEGIANDLKDLYRQHGPNPASVEAKPDKQHELILANLPLELTIADAAAFALAFYENPDVFVTISAANYSENNDEVLPSPPYLSRFFPNVMTVASVDKDGKPSSFTNYGNRSVQIAAPGENVVSTILAGLEAPMSGTSMASPEVAGIAAGIRADFPTLSAVDLRRLLEASAKRSELLVNIASTSGIVDAAAARKMAASWSKDNLAMMVEETRKAKVPGRDGPVLKVSEHAAPDPAKPKAPAAGEGKHRRITSVVGSGSEWRAVMSTGTPYENQRQLGVGEWPGKSVEEGWNLGLRITAVAGDQDGWNVVMSDGVPGNQAVYGFALDQSKIAESMQAGFRITTVAGWKDNWIVVMNDQTPLGAQRYTLPTPLTQSRRDWITQRWNEGYHITSVGGDDHPDDDGDGWFFVMSQNSGLTEQVFAGPGAWPEAWVNEQLGKGFAITSVAGVGDHTLVVMSKGTTLTDQIVSPGGAYPSSWIQEHW